jgi:hypothetical protein
MLYVVHGNVNIENLMNELDREKKDKEIIG